MASKRSARPSNGRKSSQPSPSHYQWVAGFHNLDAVGTLSCLWLTYDAQREGEGNGEGQGADLKSKQTTEAGNQVQGKLKNLTALSINETCSSCLICTIIPKDTVRLFSKFHRVA